MVPVKQTCIVLLFMGVNFLSSADNPLCMRVSPTRIEQVATRLRSHDERRRMLRYSVYATAALGIVGIVSHKIISYQQIQQRLFTVEGKVGALAQGMGMPQPVTVVAPAVPTQAIVAKDVVGFFGTLFSAGKNIVVGGAIWVGRDILLASIAKSLLGFAIDPVLKLFNNEVAIPVKSCWFLAEQYHADVTTNFAITTKDLSEFIHALTALDLSVAQIRHNIEQSKLHSREMSDKAVSSALKASVVVHCTALVRAVELIIGHLSYMHIHAQESYEESSSLSAVATIAREKVIAEANGLVTAVEAVLAVDGSVSDEQYLCVEDTAARLLAVTRTTLRPLMCHRLYRINPWPLETVAFEMVKSSMVKSAALSS